MIASFVLSLCKLAVLGTVVLSLGFFAYAAIWGVVIVLARLRVEWDQRRRDAVVSAARAELQQRLDRAQDTEVREATRRWWESR